MATESRTRDERWLSADDIRKLTAAEPEAGPAPPPVHRTDERPSRRRCAAGDTCDDRPGRALTRRLEHRGASPGVELRDVAKH